MRSTYIRTTQLGRREAGKWKDQGRGETEEKNQQEKQTTHSMSSVSHFLRFSFYTFLCGHPIWSHMTESYAIPNFHRSRFKEFFCLLIWIASSVSVE